MIQQEIEQVERYYTIIKDYLVNYSMQVVAAILILIIGLWVS